MHVIEISLLVTCLVTHANTDVVVVYSYDNAFLSDVIADVILYLEMTDSHKMYLHVAWRKAYIIPFKLRHTPYVITY